jgi:CBS-domain-containing membrane protein
MTSELLCGRTDTTLDEARGVMMKRRIRHLPIVDEDDHLLGLVSIGDLNAHLAHDQEVTIHVMQEYIQGRV